MQSLTEIEIMKDSLMSEKQVSSAYSLGIDESTCPQLKTLLSKCFNNVLGCQSDIISVMNQRGWSTAKEEDTLDIESVKNKYSKIYNELL